MKVTCSIEPSETPQEVASPERGGEIQGLHTLAYVTIGYLLFASLAAFFAGAVTIGAIDLTIGRPEWLLPVAILGLSGSGIAALTSCLERYATGFELADGTPFPKEAKKGEGKFNRRFAAWLFVRPFLGAVIAPVFIWGLSHFTKNSERFLGSNEMLGFSAFMGGLLAKSVIDLIKKLFKNVFHA